MCYPSGSGLTERRFSRSTPGGGSSRYSQSITDGVIIGLRYYDAMADRSREVSRVKTLRFLKESALSGSSISRSLLKAKGFQANRRLINSKGCLLHSKSDEVDFRKCVSAYFLVGLFLIVGCNHLALFLRGRECDLLLLS